MNRSDERTENVSTDRSRGEFTEVENNDWVKKPTSNLRRP
jgi:hypothetical protein